jgi:hypothetical protein
LRVVDGTVSRTYWSKIFIPQSHETLFGSILRLRGLRYKLFARSRMPPLPAPFLSRLRILRSAAAVSLPSSAVPLRYGRHPRFARPVGTSPLRARFPRTSSSTTSLVSSITTGFALFGMASATSVHDFTVKVRSLELPWLL